MQTHYLLSLKINCSDSDGHYLDPCWMHTTEMSPRINTDGVLLFCWPPLG